MVKLNKKNIVLNASLIYFIMMILIRIFVLNVIVGLNLNVVTLIANIALTDQKNLYLTNSVIELTTSKDKFLAAFYELKLEDVQSLIDVGKLEGTRLFLEIELNNGVSFRQLYWLDSNTFHNGAIGNDEIKEVISYEVSNLKKSSIFNSTIYSHLTFHRFKMFLDSRAAYPLERKLNAFM